MMVSKMETVAKYVGGHDKRMTLDNSNNRMQCDHNPYCQQQQQHRFNRLEQAERLYVQGDFRLALQICNRLMQEVDEDSSPERTKMDGHRLDSCLTFHFDEAATSNKGRQFSIRHDSCTDDTDRAAAIGLQCWHEIKTRRNPKDPGYRFLRPFLDLYEKKPMPLDLLVMFVQFCQTNRQESEALSMTQELLLSRLDLGKGSLVWDKSLDSCFHELMVNLFTYLLPRTEASFANDVLQNLFRNMSKAETCIDSLLPTTPTTTAQNNIQMNTVLTILNFLKGISGKEDVFEWQPAMDASKSILEEALANMKSKGNKSEEFVDGAKQSSPDISFPSEVKSHQLLGKRQLLSTRLLEWLRRISTWTRTMVLDRPGRWEKRGSLAFSLALMLLAWRRRKEVARVSKFAATLLLSPFLELVEALTASPEA